MDVPECPIAAAVILLPKKTILILIERKKGYFECSHAQNHDIIIFLRVCSAEYAYFIRG